ncbi:NUDIX hydrolase [Rhizocola hellebori]|uniref:NUDIX hydrolase n=1 Tax=Rhizocola hellebori TaxID=1392758 RepID=UPI001942752C|nr:NUDIX domain-containing protein [Rhizocola hellebori]
MEKRRRIGAYGVARDETGRVLLVRSSPRSNNPGRWALPGGGLDHGEDPNVGVVREFREETGLEVAIAGLHDVFSDVVEFPWRGVQLHHDRIIFDVKVVGGELLAETDGTTDLPAWIAEADLPNLNLNPFVAKVLGVSKAELGDDERPVRPDENNEVGVKGQALSGEKRVTRFGAYGVVTDASGRVLLSLVSQGYPSGGNWHLPGGGTDFGEQPAEGLLREIYEETGQSGEVTGLIRVGARHNPAAMGPEGEPWDWYTVRAVFQVHIPEPSEPRVTEEAGGSTADARWFTRTELTSIKLSDLARRELLHIDLPG